MPSVVRVTPSVGNHAEREPGRQGLNGWVGEGAWRRATWQDRWEGRKKVQGGTPGERGSNTGGKREQGRTKGVDDAVRLVLYA